MADLLFEIGAEEIPAGFAPLAMRQLQEDLARLLLEARLAHGEVRAMGTPREVGDRQADARSEVLGPSVAAAFDAEGKPTAAALGFARSQGVAVEALERIESPKGLRLGIIRLESGRRAAQVLPGLLARLLAGLRFKKAMRSRWDDVTFARPVRWLAALHGGKPIKVVHGEVRSGTVTFGHRFLAPGAIRLTGTPEDYLRKLTKAHVVVDPAARQAAIEAALAAAVRRGGGAIRPDPALVEQVTWLVEHPSAVLGEFEKSNLTLPPEVVVTEMRNHQRYFAVVDGKGTLTNRFVAISGTPVKDPRVSRNGYQRVLRARLADARFFFEEDRKRTLESRVADLGRRTYQARLGTELQRVERIGAVAAALATVLGKAALLPALGQATRLCKADLGTGMVGEFPELQGIMGGHYARLEGLAPEVAEALEDHYRPIGAAAEMPRGDLGALTGLADRLHQLVGIIGVGEKATGGADPFGLRRAAIAILRLVLDRDYHLSLRGAVEFTLDGLAGVKLAGDRKQVAEQVLDFLRGRLKGLWAEEYPGDLVEAVLAAGFDDVVDARQRLQALAQVRQREDFVPLAVAFKRVANIQEKAPGVGVELSPSLLAEPAERALFEALARIESEAAALRSRRDYPGVLRAVATLKPAVDAFFDQVMVMAEDAAVRANRLALMRRVAALFADVADFRKIQAELPPGAVQRKA
jgi:glycyl-tRNA synthetase beta chain